MKQKVAIFCGGPSSEHEVSINSASTIYRFIDKKKYELYFFYISKNLKAKLLIATDAINLSEIKPTSPLTKGLEQLYKRRIFAFLGGIHGEFVEDGRLQNLLEFYKISYSGSGVSASSLAMDKYRSSILVSTIKSIRIPNTFLLTKTFDFPNELEFPVIIKPNTMGSSVGVSISKNKKEFEQQINQFRQKYPDQEIVIQEYLEGALEIQCGTLQKKTGEFVKIPPIEIIPNKNVFFDYDSKYSAGGAKEITPPISISQEMSQKITDLSVEVHKLLALRTYSRNDFLVHNDKIYFLETNTLPGMTQTSLLPQEANAAGISFPQLITFIIENS